MSWIDILSIVTAPVILCLFGIISAYVLRFGLPRSGINFDYILFTLVVVLAVVIGGAV